MKACAFLARALSTRSVPLSLIESLIRQHSQRCLPMDEQRLEQLLQTVQTRPPVVFYHYPCLDGVFAALAATLFFQQQGVTPRYVPHPVYKTPDLDALQLQPADVAFLLDYAGGPGFPQQLSSRVGQVVVLDHHKTAAAQLADTARLPANVAVHINMQQSGATISRDFFKLSASLSPALQQMFRWVEDADLWRWALPDSQAFHAGMSGLKLEYDALLNPAIFEQLQALDMQRVLQQGAHALGRQQQLVQEVLSAAQLHQLGGAAGLTRGWGSCLGLVVGSPDLVKVRSMLGNRLAVLSKERGLSPVGLVAYTEDGMPNKDTHIKVSLRSVDDFDTCAVSQAFGGGGHQAASSCIITRAELLGWRAMAGG